METKSNAEPMRESERKRKQTDKFVKLTYWLMVLFSVIVSCDYIVTWLWRICRLFRSVPWIEDVRSIVEPVG